jgi:hypothetical protein
MIVPRAKKAASTHLRDGKVFLQPCIRIGKAAWRDSTPVLVANVDDQGLGALVLLALSKSREEPGPPFFYKNEHESPLLRTAGYRSYEAFYDTAKSVSISWDDTGINDLFKERRAGQAIPAFEKAYSLSAGRGRHNRCPQGRLRCL